MSSLGSFSSFKPQNRKAWPWTGGGMFLYRQFRLRLWATIFRESERIVCACDKVTKTVESGSSTEDEPAPTSFEGLPVRSCPYHHSVACRWGPTSLKQARGSLVCPEFLEAGGSNEPLRWYYKRVTPGEVSTWSRFSQQTSFRLQNCFLRAALENA